MISIVYFSEKIEKGRKRNCTVKNLNLKRQAKHFKCSKEEVEIIKKLIAKNTGIQTDTEYTCIVYL